MDLITNQRLTWRSRGREDDGRAFEVTALGPTDDPELLQEASDARGALIEQVRHTPELYCSASQVKLTGI